MATPQTTRKRGKFKLTARFLELRKTNDVIHEAVLFSAKKKYCFVVWNSQLSMFTGILPNDQVIVRFNIESKSHYNKYYTNLYVVSIEKKADADKRKIESLKEESEYKSATIFQQNHDFDNQ